MAQLGFQADQYQPADDFSPLPAGEYTAMMTESEVVNTSTGGSMVKITYTVMDGEFQGRKFWSQHNIVNRSPKAEEIGRREISRIAHMIGLPTLVDSDQLVNQTVRVTVVIKQNPGYDPRNEVKKWAPAGGAQQGYQPAPHQAQPQQQAPQQAQPQQQAAPMQNQYIPAATAPHQSPQQPQHQHQPAPQQPAPQTNNAVPPWGQT